MRNLYWVRIVEMVDVMEACVTPYQQLRYMFGITSDGGLCWEYKDAVGLYRFVLVLFNPEYDELPAFAYDPDFHPWTPDTKSKLIEFFIEKFNKDFEVFGLKAEIPSITKTF